MEAFEWAGYNPADTEGFEAYRKGETLSAMWRNNGSHLLLYWGHQVPATPAQKRDDELLQAVVAEDVARVQAAVSKGASPNALDYSGDSVLNLAAKTGNIPIVEALMRAQQTAPDTAEVELNLYNWLGFAAQRDDVELLQFFIGQGATPFEIGAALQSGAASGALKCVTVLLPHAPRADVNTALSYAAFAGEWRGSTLQYPDIVKLLLTRKPDKRALDVALLRVAGFDDQGSIAPLLLEAGANPNASDAQGQTALIHALKDYDPNSVRNLLKAGADPNAQDAKGTPALILAMLLGDEWMLEELIEHGADLSARTRQGRTAMEVAQLNLAKYTEKSAQKKNFDVKGDQDTRDKFRRIVTLIQTATQTRTPK